MTTVRTIVSRTLRRLDITPLGQDPSADDAEEVLSVLNDMVFGWAAHGVDVLQQSAFGLSDTFVFWVPPVALESGAISAASYRGTWNASTNSPTLASATGTEGDVYRVSVAGSTTLDDVTSWAVDDFAVYDGTEWLKGISSQRFEGGIVALLIARVASHYGVPVPADAAMLADSTWRSMQSCYIKPPTAGFDRAIRDVPSRGSVVRWDEA